MKLLGLELGDVTAGNARPRNRRRKEARRWQLPVYRVVGTTGAAHQQTFDVECEVSELKQSQRGIGSSRRSGEQAAALAMLQWLKEHPQ